MTKTPTNPPDDCASDIKPWRWLITAAGLAELDSLRRDLDDGVSEIKSLRDARQRLQNASLPEGMNAADAARLALSQVRLREAATSKFTRAEEMLFESVLLQQASSESLARFKAQRFAKASHVVDICCGLGGDAVGLNEVISLTAVDRSEQACLLTRHNLTVCSGEGRPGFEVVQQAAENTLYDEDTAVHIDPDRRAEGPRTTHVDFMSPGQAVLESLLNRSAGGAIKLAPATLLPDAWVPRVEQQWLGDSRECKQQLVWFGDLASGVGARRASAVDAKGCVLFDWTPQPNAIDGAASAGFAGDDANGALDSLSGQVLHEPHPTVLAAGLADALADETSLRRLGPDVDYFLGLKRSTHAALTAFQILEAVRLDRKTVTAALRAHDAGQLEIKKRGVDHRLIADFARLKLSGAAQRVLVLTRIRSAHVALICARL